MLDTLEIAAQGHVVVGVLRLLGFHVPRNTDKPLLSRSVVEFWNRYYFYFKELMVEFFFLPTFARCFRTRPRLRMTAAVLAAAFAGNVYYHLLKTQLALVAVDWHAILEALEPRVLYATLLAGGIAVSMAREQNRRTRPGAALHLPAPLRVAVVWTYVAVIRIWACRHLRGGGHARGARFLLMLTGLRVRERSGGPVTPLFRQPPEGQPRWASARARAARARARPTRPVARVVRG